MKFCNVDKNVVVIIIVSVQFKVLFITGKPRFKRFKTNVVLNKNQAFKWNFKWLDLLKELRVAVESDFLDKCFGNLNSGTLMKNLKGLK